MSKKKDNEKQIIDAEVLKKHQQEQSEVLKQAIEDNVKRAKIAISFEEKNGMPYPETTAIYKLILSLQDRQDKILGVKLNIKEEKQKDEDDDFRDD